MRTSVGVIIAGVCDASDAALYSGVICWCFVLLCQLFIDANMNKSFKEKILRINNKPIILCFVSGFTGSTTQE